MEYVITLNEQKLKIRMIDFNFIQPFMLLINIDQDNSLLINDNSIHFCLQKIMLRYNLLIKSVYFLRIFSYYHDNITKLMKCIVFPATHYTIVICSIDYEQIPQL